jgi:hypothetical protein
MKKTRQPALGLAGRSRRMADKRGYPDLAAGCWRWPWAALAIICRLIQGIASPSLVLTIRIAGPAGNFKDRPAAEAAPWGAAAPRSPPPRAGDGAPHPRERRSADKVISAGGRASDPAPPAPHPGSAR